MKRYLAALLCSLLLYSAAQAEVRQFDSLIVLAEPSLALPLAEITRAYSVHKQVTLLTTFADSRSHAEQLQEGEGDVLLTSLPSITQELRQMGLVDVYSQTMIAGNALVLAAAEHAPVNVTPLLQLLAGRPVLVADPQRFTEGYYGTDAYTHLNAAGDLPASETEASLDTLYSRIEEGAGWGIMLGTEARLQPWIGSTIPLSGETYDPIFYQAMVIAGDKMELSRDFVKYLKSENAQAIFKRYGFSQP